MRMIGEPRPLTRDDLGRLFEPAYKPVIAASALRNSHHRIARLAAAGLRQHEISEKTGYSPNRISVLLASPAMVDLVDHYRGMVDAAFVRAQDEFHSLAQRNMLLAEGMINDRLEEDGDPLPIKDLIAISRDAADRLGYAKKSMVFNTNLDFAAALERANERSNKGAALPEALEMEADA